MTAAVAVLAACLAGVAAPVILAGWLRTSRPLDVVGPAAIAPPTGAGVPAIAAEGEIADHGGRVGDALPATPHPEPIHRAARREPAAAATAAVLAAATVVHFGVTWQLPVHLWVALCAVVLGVVDLRFRRLPDVLVLPATVGLFVLLTLATAAGSGWSALLRSVAAGLALFAVYLLLSAVSPAGLGMGDVKLAVAVGAYPGFFGWKLLASATLLSFLAVAVVSLVLVLARRATRSAAVPFGPMMLLGALAAVWIA